MTELDTRDSPRTYEQYNTAAVFSLDEIPPLSIPRQFCAGSLRSRKDQFSYTKPPRHRLVERGQEVSALPSIEFINRFQGSVCDLESAPHLFRHIRFNSPQALPHIEPVQSISQTVPQPQCTTFYISQAFADVVAGRTHTTSLTSTLPDSHALCVSMGENTSRNQSLTQRSLHAKLPRCALICFVGTFPSMRASSLVPTEWLPERQHDRRKRIVGNGKQALEGQGSAHREILFPKTVAA